MVAISRVQFKNAIDHVPCHIWLHPDETSCTIGTLDLAYAVMKGSIKYFALMYAAQNALRYKSLKTDDIKPLLTSFCRSVMMTVLGIPSFTGLICLWKNLTGTYNRDVVAYWAPALSGIFIYVDDPKRRPIVVYTLTALGLEALIRRLYKRINRPKAIETLVFMVFNGILMYKMRSTEVARLSRDIWFFRPSRFTKDKAIEEAVDKETGETTLNACPHAEMACTAKQCFKGVLNETAKYVGVTTLFTVAKLLLTQKKLRTSPFQLLKKMMEWDNMRLAAFFGWYVGVFRGISCYLCRMNKTDCAEHSLIAGFLAGISYRFNMNLTIFSSVILYVARVFGRELQQKFHLPKYHFVELGMIWSMIVLLNTTIFDPESCPKGFTFMMNTITKKKFETALKSLYVLMQKEILRSS